MAKYKILELDGDSNDNLTVEVEFSDGARKGSKTFNFEPKTTKTAILKQISESCPIPKKTAEEIAKATALASKKTSMAVEVGKIKDTVENKGI